MAAKFIVLIVHLWSISFFCFLKSEEVTTKNYLDDFLKWFEDHGGRCRCKFTEAKDKTLTAISDRKIVDKESILMVPQSIVVNFTVIERLRHYINCFFPLFLFESRIMFDSLQLWVLLIIILLLSLFVHCSPPRKVFLNTSSTYQ